MLIDDSKEQHSLDGFRIFDLLNEIYLEFNPYDNIEKYEDGCRKKFAGIENDKNIESLKDDLLSRWKNGQIDLIKNKEAIPDRNITISLLQKGSFVITDYNYLFYKMKHS
ncbi:MAG: hypothetical protein V1874_10055 [Spirochaetota bacterium]